MESIKDTVASVMQGLAEKKGAGAGFPEDAVKKVLTKKELTHIKVKYFKKGVLGIDVDSSVWLYALNLKKEALTKKLAAIESAIKDIRFRLGEVT